MENSEKTAASVKVGTRGSWRKKQQFFIIGMLSVALINFVIFWLYVNFSSILMAFQTPADDKLTLVNFKNLFEEFGRKDSVISSGLVNTLKFFAVGLLVITPLSLIFSYFLYKKIAGYRIFRIIFFFPSIISVVVLTSLYGYMVAPEGIVTKIVMFLFGMEKTPILLGESRYALTTIIFYCVWTGFGVNIVLFNGAMARIPYDIIEYDQLEGVGFARELFQIVVPMIWPTISTVLVLAVVGLFNSSGPILFFTLGQHDTYTISYWIFEQVYMKSVYEYASAVGLFFTIVGLPIVMIVKWLLDKVGTEIEY